MQRKKEGSTLSSKKKSWGEHRAPGNGFGKRRIFLKCEGHSEGGILKSELSARFRMKGGRQGRVAKRSETIEGDTRRKLRKGDVDWTVGGQS